MPVEKQIDSTLVELAQWQTALTHPARQMRNARKVLALSAAGISALPQVRSECVGVRRQNAVRQM
jgi:hypothetical protein